MTAPELNRLNKIFADKRGLNEYGEPLYMWVRSPKLTFPQLVSNSRASGGVVLIDSGYEWTPQIDEDRWVVALWRRDEPNEWKAMFGEEVPYPERGLYYATNMMLKEGLEPCENVTNYFADLIAKQAQKSYRDIYREILAHQEQRKAASENYIASVVDECVPAFFNGEPGKRGNHVSFGGIE